MGYQKTRLKRTAKFLLLAIFLAGASDAAQVGYQNPWRFAFIGCPHFDWTFGGTNPRNDVPLNDVMDSLLVLSNFKGLIIGGDLSERIFRDNVNSNLENFLVWQARADGHFPIYPVIGNWEALTEDTLAYHDPYVSARARFPQYFTQSKDYYSVDINNVHFVALQNNANVNITNDTDYRQNNPFNYVSPGYSTTDFDGIMSASSPQRTWLATDLAAMNPSKILVFSAHRPTYGTDEVTARMNLNAGRGTGYIKQIEDALPTGRRAVGLFADQHIPVWQTYAIVDSAISGATIKGIYHLVVASGSGARPADTTDVMGSSMLQSFLYYESLTRLRGRTSEAWADTITYAADPGIPHTVTWALMTVYGDDILCEVFRVWTTEDAGHPLYNGAGTHRLVNRYVYHGDVTP